MTAEERVIIKMLVAWSESSKYAQNWLIKKHQAFNGRRPIDLCNSGEVFRVARYIRDLNSEDWKM
ncbi:antitoxin Xre/MbcA/ParS toxin-binding domain-containing protein [Leisingera sp. D0M16]|uniref:antitoxin Xre/MbcA/ParS toxin-binding domain-containing protein n=1 Tax=Leisingera coralii TaxID=3351347 RepID=UPI003B825279